MTMNTKLPKFRYSRPSFLQLKNDDEILVSADHQVRPIILPRDISSLPWKSGYAECINAGKSKHNEDQAASYQDIVVRHSSSLEFNSTSSSLVRGKQQQQQQQQEKPAILDQLPWTYFGIFDGHAGPGVAVAAANQLHDIVADRLQSVADLLISLEFDRTDNSTASTNGEDKPEAIEIKAKAQEHEQEQEKSPISVSSDASIEEDKQEDETPNTDHVDNFPTTGPPTKEAPAPIANNNNNNNIKNHDSNVNGLLKKERKVHFDSNVDQKVSEMSSDMIEICRNNISVDSLIVGALEASFWTMDALIANDKQKYKMAGGCTAIVGIFILGKLFICNAGDSRAIVIKGNQVIPMSCDFTPTSERERILRLGQQRPEFLGNEFTCLEFIKRPTRKDMGKQMLYRNAFMTGWSIKQITYDDLKLPLVSGIGKRSRVLATIGVTRGFGDHELRAQYGSVLIKPFLTPEPEIRIIQLEEDDSLTLDDVLVIGTDGLWDVVTNLEVAHTVKSSFGHFSETGKGDSLAKFRYVTAAQDLVIKSRGNVDIYGNDWRTDNDRPASLDDISVFVIPLKHYRDEYIEWKRLRSLKVQELKESPTNINTTTNNNNQNQ